MSPQRPVRDYSSQLAWKRQVETSKPLSAGKENAPWALHTLERHAALKRHKGQWRPRTVKHRCSFWKGRPEAGATWLLERSQGYLGPGWG